MEFLRPTPYVILLDIEGTTTSISFVKEVLFPYAAQHVEEFLKEYWDDGEVQEIVSDLRKECGNDVANGVAGVEIILDDGTGDMDMDIGRVQESVVRNILWQMKNDMKRTPLKALQGKIWKYGFEGGHLHGHVFEDVPSAFQRFQDSHQKICIYSSGSVEAQKLLFKHSIAGDLSMFISDYFDTTVGAKGECESYANIAKHLNVDPKEILFFTDVPAEGYAAREACLGVVLMVRPGNAPLTPQHTQAFTIANHFKEF